MDHEGAIFAEAVVSGVADAPDSADAAWELQCYPRDRSAVAALRRFRRFVEQFDRRRHPVGAQPILDCGGRRGGCHRAAITIVGYCAARRSSARVFGCAPFLVLPTSNPGKVA